MDSLNIYTSQLFIAVVFQHVLHIWGFVPFPTGQLMQEIIF